MNHRALATISILLLSTAALAGPAFAQASSPPGKGTGADTTRAAPVTLPDAKPKALPKVDPGAASRGPLDAAAAVAGYATVTLNKDGTTTETEASDSLRAILGAEASPPTGSTTGELVIPKDDRVQITDSSVYPYSAVGWLFTQDQKGDWATCSATLVGPKTVITAAHCVFDHPTGGWVQQIIFVPGATDAETAPFGTYDWDSVHILKGYIENYDGENYGSVMPWDLAVINLIEPAGDTLGWMGFQVDVPGSWAADIIGYPSDKPDGTMWESKCDIADTNYADLQGAEGLMFWHLCDTYSGSSGSAIFELDSENLPYVRGVNTAEDDKRNYGTSFNDANFDWLASYYQ